MKKINMMIMLLIAFNSAFVNASDESYGRYEKYERHEDHHSQRRRESCIKEFWNKISENRTGLGKCVLRSPLTLQEGTRVYPLMDLGALTVRFWSGSFSRDYKLTQVYEHAYANVCAGGETYKETRVFESNQSLDFAIVNPNLDDGITETFRLAPLTKKEAQESMEDLKKQCESAQL